MNIYDYIILAALAACVVLALVFIVRAKKKGKNICCGNCSRCSSCNECAEREKNPKKNKHKKQD
ncbi:MAG: FeoB-associated Cys-rich membrane protein [Clostridia bacterium]